MSKGERWRDRDRYTQRQIYTDRYRDIHRENVKEVFPKKLV